MVNVLNKNISQYGMDLMLVLTLAYLIFVWNWNPYNKEVNFHNRALKLNHFSAFYFVLACELFTQINLSPTIFSILIYPSLLLMLAVTFCAFVRLYVEFSFRKKLVEDPTLMQEKNKELENEKNPEILKLSKRERLIMHNKYAIESQIKDMFKVSNLLIASDL